VSLILRVFVVGVDLQGVLLRDRAQQIEARVLIPSPAFVEINEREKNNRAQQRYGLPVRRGNLGQSAHPILRAQPDALSIGSLAKRAKQKSRAFSVTAPDFQPARVTLSMPADIPRRSF
jgi:hypothetical protein